MRVSTDGRPSTSSGGALKAAGCKRVFEDKASGAQRGRLELAKMLDYLQPGDVVTVTRLDRLVRSTRDLLDVRPPPCPFGRADRARSPAHPRGQEAGGGCPASRRASRYPLSSAWGIGAAGADDYMLTGKHVCLAPPESRRDREPAALASIVETPRFQRLGFKSLQNQ